MDTFLRFLYEFLGQFFGGFLTIATAIADAVMQIFDFRSYLKILNFYKDDFNGAEWVFIVIAIILMLLVEKKSGK